MRPRPPLTRHSCSGLCFPSPSSPHPPGRLGARTGTSGSHRGCHASRRCCTAEGRTRSRPRQLLPPSAQHRTSIRLGPGPAGPEPLPAGEHPGQAGRGNRDGAEPLGELQTAQPCASAAGGRVGELPRDCFGELGLSSLEERRLQGDLRAHFSPTEELWLPQLWECSRPGWTVKTWGSGRWGALGGL